MVSGKVPKTMSLLSNKPRTSKSEGTSKGSYPLRKSNLVSSDGALSEWSQEHLPKVVEKPIAAIHEGVLRSELSNEHNELISYKPYIMYHLSLLKCDLVNYITALPSTHLPSHCRALVSQAPGDQSLVQYDRIPRTSRSFLRGW